MNNKQLQQIAFKISKLAEYFDCSPDDVSDIRGMFFEYEEKQFLVLSDKEADKKTREVSLLSSCDGQEIELNQGFFAYRIK